jgi:heme/copper-type cytochrome/quinol oxidase subunit 2
MLARPAAPTFPGKTRILQAMQSHRERAATRPRRRPARSPWWALAAFVLALGLAGCSSGGDEDSAQPSGTTQASATTAASGTTEAASTARTIQIRVTGDQVETAERRVKVPLGSDVRLEVTADRADEVHLHGYDRKVDIEPGTPAVLEFQADTPGVFEVELEEAALKLVELQVE